MILDTNAISDFADANQRLLDRIQQADDDLHLPVIVLGDIWEDDFKRRKTS